MLSILSTLVPVFGIILLGIIVERMDFMPKETSVCLNQFVYWIGLPLLLFNALARMEAGQLSPALLWGILLGLLIPYAAAYLFFFIQFPQRRQEGAVFALLSSFPNSAFMGLPIVVLLLPGNEDAALIASVGAVLGIVNLLFTDAVLEMGRHCGEGRRKACCSLLRSLYRNPMLICSGLGVLVSLLHIRVPQPLMAIASMLGSPAAPCALFCMGMILSVQMTSSHGFVKGWARRQFPLHALKLAGQPLLTFAVLYGFGVRGIAVAVATLVSAMPAGVAAYIIAEKYQVYTEDSSLGIVINTGLSALTIPLIVMTLQYYGFV